MGNRPASAHDRFSAGSRAFIALCSIGPLGVGMLAGAQSSATPPVPREHSQPNPPKNQFGGVVVGWAKVRYSVRADGTTADVRAVETMPLQLQIDDVERVVEGWTFTPAELDGETIDWHNNESIVTFRNDSTAPGPTRFFSEAYMGAVELLGQQKLAEALEANGKLLSMASQLTEIGLARAQAALAHSYAGDAHSAYAAILDATDPRVPTLEDEELRQALEIRFVIEIQLGRAMEAIETFARRSELGELTNESLAARAAALEEALKSDAPIAIKGRVDGNPWRHTPSRRTFTLTDIDGGIDEIHAECDTVKQVLPYVAEVDWTLPAVWGACTLFVHAKRDTTFSLYEFK